MITVTSKGEYMFMSIPMLLVLTNEKEDESAKTVYRFDLSQSRGNIKLASTNEFTSTEKLLSGRFRIYEVLNEQSFKNGTQLEICKKAGEWSCYVLPEGLPDKNNRVKNFFITNNCITKMSMN